MILRRTGAIMDAEDEMPMEGGRKRLRTTHAVRRWIQFVHDYYQFNARALCWCSSNTCLDQCDVCRNRKIRQVACTILLYLN